MMGKTWREAAQAIADEIVALLERKQRDYGYGNIEAFGEFGILVRASDKLARLTNLRLTGAGETRNESIEDSWVDLAGYAILALMVRRGAFRLPLADAPAPSDSSTASTRLGAEWFSGTRYPEEGDVLIKNVTNE